MGAWTAMAGGVARAGAVSALAVVLGAEAPVPGGTVEMTVLGVVSPSATFGLTRHLLGIPGVRTMRFDLQHGLATMQLAPDAMVTDEQLREAVRGAAYTPGDIHRIPPAP